MYKMYKNAENLNKLLLALSKFGKKGILKKSNINIRRVLIRYSKVYR